MSADRSFYRRHHGALYATLAFAASMNVERMSALDETDSQAGKTAIERFLNANHPSSPLRFEWSDLKLMRRHRCRVFCEATGVLIAQIHFANAELVDEWQAGHALRAILRQGP
jgi:lauroyl/myristoyl acyltransferase